MTTILLLGFLRPSSFPILYIGTTDDYCICFNPYSNGMDIA
ncbi:hypothetical protein [Leptothermofonsia sp. ETS-13]